jgi:hypothetical protein
VRVEILKTLTKGQDTCQFAIHLALQQPRTTRSRAVGQNGNGAPE